MDVSLRERDVLLSFKVKLGGIGVTPALPLLGVERTVLEEGNRCAVRMAAKSPTDRLLITVRGSRAPITALLKAKKKIKKKDYNASGPLW